MEAKYKALQYFRYEMFNGVKSWLEEQNSNKIENGLEEQGVNGSGANQV